MDYYSRYSSYLITETLSLSFMYTYEVIVIVVRRRSLGNSGEVIVKLMYILFLVGETSVCLEAYIVVALVPASTQKIFDTLLSNTD